MVNSTPDTIDLAVTADQMLMAQVQHLRWLETYTRARPDLHVAGIDLLPCFTYELAQVMNHRWLQAAAMQQAELEQLQPGTETQKVTA